MTPLSAELKRFLRYVADKVGPLPATLDDAAEMLLVLTDRELAVICGATPGERVRAKFCTLESSCELRQHIECEIDELELNASVENGDRWLEPLLSQPR